MAYASELILYGAGGHASVLLDVALASNIRFDKIIDVKPRLPQLLDIPIVAASEFNFRECGPFRFIVAIGDNSIRRGRFLDLQSAGTPINLVHPFTSISTRASLGRGVAIMPGVVVNTGVRIGDNVILNTSCSVDHDCVVGEHSHICPGVHIAGNVVVGPGTMIGAGAAVIPGVKIGENCTIGAGAVVVRDIPDGSTAFGNPSRVHNASKRAVAR